MLSGIGALTYAVTIVVADHGEPLIWIMVALVGLPAVAPVFLGYQMLQGREWAVRALRFWFMAVLLTGVLLQVIVGLDLLAFPPLAVLLVGWVVLSFR
jgi:hypothetical protein